MRTRRPVVLSTLALLLGASFVAHAAKTTRTARTVQFANHISVTGFQPDPTGGWFLIQSYANEAEGQMSNTVIDPSKLCALPADDPASDQIFMSNLHKPGKASRNKALRSMAWSWKLNFDATETGASGTVTAVIYLRKDGQLSCMHEHNSNYDQRKKTRLFK